MNEGSHAPPLVLSGIDSGNPLGFLAALGTAILANSFCQKLRFCWCIDKGTWRPALSGCGTDKARFIERLLDAMNAASMKPFEIDDKMPFSVELFETSLKEALRTASPANRRVADFLAAFGSEIKPKIDPNSKERLFQDTRFRMLRSGDSKSRGLPAYARVIRSATSREALECTLFRPWDYQDEAKKRSLRWDPIEDKRYALRWRDPSESNLKDGPGTMIGANSLALEALQWYPTMYQSNHLATTGFHRNSNNEVWFTWPIWDRPISLDTVRSLLTLPDLHNTKPPRVQLARRGIIEIYRCQRIQQSKYYSNFTSAQPA